MHQLDNTSSKTPESSSLGSSLGSVPALPAGAAARNNPVTIADCLRQHAIDRADKTAFSFFADGQSLTESMTFAELDRRVDQLASHLSDAGLQGQRAALLYPSGLDFVVALCGCWRAGAIAVPAHPPHGNRHGKRVESIIDDCRASVVLTTTNERDRVEPLLARRSGSSLVLATDALPNIEGNFQPGGLKSSDLAMLQYTSGSTGDPKGVCITHDNLLCNARIIADAFEATADSHGVFWLPMYHDMGLIGGIVVPLLLGASSSLMPANQFIREPIRWLKLIAETGADISGGPNFAYDLCVDRTNTADRMYLDLSSWRIAFNGAEPVSATTIDRFAVAFADNGFSRRAIYPCYGLAESTLLVTGGQAGRSPRIRPQEASKAKLVSCGRTRGDSVIRIVDERGNSLHSGAVGEICIRGCSVAAGYFGQQHNERFDCEIAGEPEKYFRTGDLGFLDRGELFVTGRAKDMLVIRGQNYFPHDIERTSRAALPQLKHAPAAVFTTQQSLGESIVVLQESPQRHPENPEQIVATIRDAVVAEHGVTPAAVLLLKPGQIRRTTSGKVQRAECCSAFEKNELSALASWAASASSTEQQSTNRTEPLTLASLLKLIEHTFGQAPSKVDESSRIESLGLDSLQTMELVSAVESKFGVVIDESALVAAETLGDLLSRARQQDIVENDSPCDVAESDWNFAKSAEYLGLQAALRLAEQSDLPNPYFLQHEGIANDCTMIGGRQYINFCSYNYLGMSGRPEVIEAAKRATDLYGTSVSASRVVAGERPLHGELERAIADFLEVEDAITFVGGHATNESVIGHMFGPGDLVLHDSLAHNSIVQGCQLSGATRRSFPHNDFQACEELLRSTRGKYRRVLIAIEGVYSMDGDLAPLPEFVEIKKLHRSYLLVDEAHSLGTVGLTGRGVGEHYSVERGDVDFWMGTLSKSLASCGGYIAARKEIVEYLRYTAPGFVYSVGLSPPNAAAALAALGELKKSVGNVMLLRENSRRFLAGVRRLRLDSGMSEDSPIVPVIVGNSIAALHLSNRLFADGVHVQPILAPAVPESAARLRFFMTSLHSAEQIDATLQLLEEHSRDLPRE